MARQEAHPLMISRRVCVKAGLVTAAGLVLTTAGLVSYESYKQRPEERSMTDAEKNLATAIELMDSLDHELVKDAVKFYRSNQNQSVNFIDSGFNTEPARVTTSAVGQKRKLQIVLTLDQFTNEQFQAKKAAISLFSAYDVYQHAKDDPKRFSRYSGYQNFLKQQADDLALQIFSEK